MPGSRSTGNQGMKEVIDFRLVASESTERRFDM